MRGPGLLEQRRSLARTPDLWQFDLLGADAFASFAQSRSIQILNGETVYNLWYLGLLRAELIASRNSLDVPFVDRVGEHEGRLLYCDARPVQHRSEGYGGSFVGVPKRPDDCEVLFHPYRLYVLYHVARVFQAGAMSTQYL